MRARPAMTILALVLLAAGTVRADAAKDAGQAVRRGRDLESLGKLEEALAEYQRAAQLVPDANVPHRFAGDVLERLSRWADAAKEYEAYLRIRPDVSDAAAVRERIAKIREEHLVGRLTVRCTPSVVNVRVDGETVDASRPIALAIGAHDLRVEAAGHAPLVTKVEIAAGAATTPPCSLVPDSQPAPARGAPAPALREEPQHPVPASSSSPWYSRWWVYAIGGVVIGGATAAVIVANQSPAGPPASAGGDHRFP